MNTSIINQVESFARDAISAYADPSHDWSHIERVRRMALWLGSTVGGSVDLELVELAALLHDVGDAKYANNISAESSVDTSW